jgi:hypothetical protein
MVSLQGLAALSSTAEELQAIGNELAGKFAEGAISSAQALAAQLRPFSPEERQVIAGAFVSETLETELAEAALGILAKENAGKMSTNAKIAISVGVGLVGYLLFR